MTVTPAYGRDYRSKKAALQDWNDNKDFIIADVSNPWNGKPINRSQAEEIGYKIRIRYNSLKRICNV